MFLFSLLFVCGLPKPQGFPELLKYAGFAWAIETELASAEDTTGYWKNVPPVYKVRIRGHC